MTQDNSLRGVMTIIKLYLWFFFFMFPYVFRLKKSGDYVWTQQFSLSPHFLWINFKSLESFLHNQHYTQIAPIFFAHLLFLQNLYWISSSAVASSPRTSPPEPPYNPLWCRSIESTLLNTVGTIYVILISF